MPLTLKQTVHFNSVVNGILSGSAARLESEQLKAHADKTSGKPFSRCQMQLVIGSRHLCIRVGQGFDLSRLESQHSVVLYVNALFSSALLWLSNI